MNIPAEDEQEYGLFLQETERIPAAIVNMLRLLLHYRYGLEILSETSIQEALPLSSRYGSRICCLFYVKDQPLENRNTLMALGRRAQIPLFLLVPRVLVDHHKLLCKGLKNLFVCAWEDAAGTNGPSLQQVVMTVFDQQGVGQVRIDEPTVALETLQRRLEQRLKYVNSLPTLPGLVLRVSRQIADPAARIEDLEELLVADPAIVYRLLKVISSPLFAKRRASGEWTLREAVVRLGLKQVGAIVQQIKLVNGMVRPEKNRFDIQRFWQHSVGVAIIADKLYVEKRVLLPEAIPFDHYWIGGLLHDVGKLVMGFFFWDTFAGVLKRMNTPKTPFHWAEVRLGNPITHEQIGQFVLTRAKAESEIVEVVGCHNSIGRRPNGLTCLIHVADNLCKDLGLGYLEKERAVYSPSVLDALQVREEDLEKLKDAVGGPMVDEIEDLVGRCAEEGN